MIGEQPVDRDTSEVQAQRPPRNGDTVSAPPRPRPAPPSGPQKPDSEPGANAAGGNTHSEQADAPTPAAPPPDDRPSFDEVTAQIRALLIDCYQTFDKDAYAALNDDLMAAYMPEGTTKLNLMQLGYDQAVEVLAAIKQRRGDPVEQAAEPQQGALA